MIVEIGSHKLFHGFYESMYDNSDMFIDEEYNVQDRLRELLPNEKIDVECEIDEYDKYKKDVCKEFMRIYVETILDVLPYEITNHNDFKFDIVDDENNIVVVSPKYYNFTTDKCYCNIDTNIETLEMIKEYTLNLDGAKEYIIETHSSRDGFISFIKNDIDYWKKMSIEEYIYEERYLIALLDMLILLESDNDVSFNMNYDVLDKVDVLEYTKTYVNYDNKEYELYEFLKLKNIEL